METPTPRWMTGWLRAAALYNLLWGGWVVLDPDGYFRWLSMEPPRYPELWQCIGMIVGVYGIGYAVAARDPLRHWPIVLVGLTGKLLGPIGFVVAIARGSLPTEFGWTLLTNDLLWWAPFTGILWAAWREASRPSRDSRTEEPARGDARQSLHQTRTSWDLTLAEHSEQRPHLLVFTRHFGCTFCREALADLFEHRGELETEGTGMIIVHMGSEEEGERVLGRYGLGGVPHVSDPTAWLYRSFGLDRGSFVQLFGWRSWVRGFIAGVIRGHGVGGLSGDGFRMPGVFLLDGGKVVREHRHAHASDAPDYVELARCPLPGEAA